MKKTFYYLILLVVITFTSGLNGQEKTNDVNSAPLIANCEQGNTRDGRLSCIRNAVGGVVKYIDVNEIVHGDQRVNVRLKLKISETGDITLEKVEHDNSEIRKEVTSAFRFWKNKNKDIVVKPAQKNGENTSISMELPLIFLGPDF